MITVVAISIVMLGLVLLALVGRDVWLRTLAARSRALSEVEREALAKALAVLGDRCSRIEADVKQHHDRLLAQERKQPAPRRA